MTALTRKMLRDLWLMKGQAVAIALVMACGIATFVLSRSMLHSLELTQRTYYQRYNFADVFASLKRAPDSLRDRLAEVPGVGQVQTRIVVNVNLVYSWPRRAGVGQIDFTPRNLQAAA